MQQCFFSDKHKKELHLNLIMGFLVLGGFGFCSIYTVMIGPLKNNNGNLAFWGWIFFIFCTISYLCFIYAIDTREYQLTAQGITIRYLHRFTVFYQWDNFSSIHICHLHYAPKNSALYDTAIRCVVGIEKKGPFSHPSRKRIGQWQEFDYTRSHYKKVLVIEYSETRWTEFVQSCPCTIRDIRKETERPV